jgi:hypothetical protein
MPRPKTGLLIIRAWIEVGSAKPLRAQIRSTGDVSAGITKELTLADAASVTVAVEAWMNDIMRNGDASPGGGPNA